MIHKGTAKGKRFDYEFLSLFLAIHFYCKKLKINTLNIIKFLKITIFEM